MISNAAVESEKFEKIRKQIDELMGAAMHYGHKTHQWNPKMLPYIFTEIQGTHIIDIVQTLSCLKKACNFVEECASQGKSFLFVGTKPTFSHLIERAAKQSNSHYVNSRWLGGTLTNWETMQKRLEKFKKLEKLEQSGILDLLSTKESRHLKKKLAKLHKYLDGIKNMDKLPGAIIVIDQHRDITAIKEARALDIPIISILDTDCNPDIIDIPIPGNDDSHKSIKLVTQSLVNKIISGGKK
jgi:small subunit ribosomal protein S2